MPLRRSVRVRGLTLKMPRAGGASVMTAAARVTFWGALAMALTAGVGALLGVAG